MFKYDLILGPRSPRFDYWRDKMKINAPSTPSSQLVFRRQTMKRHVSSTSQTLDAFYDRGSIFPLNRFLNDGAPWPKIIGMESLFREINRVVVCLSHGIIPRDAVWSILTSVFGWGVELLAWGALPFSGWASIVEPLSRWSLTRRVRGCDEDTSLSLDSLEWILLLLIATLLADKRLVV